MATVENLVDKLRELGGGANNPDLKAALAVKDKEYDLLKKSALKAGLVVPGRGFGGRLVLPEAVQASTSQPSQRASVGHPTPSYDALSGKRIVIMDSEGKPLLKPLKIGQLAVTQDMVVAVVE